MTSFFFGDSSDNYSSLKSMHPDFTFSEVKQEHGNILVKASDSVVSADALWTNDSSRALLIKTADCLPILISHPNFICAIHAGWRGVLNEIIVSSLQQLLSQFGLPHEAHLQIGPHIQKDSFEISSDIYPQFERIARQYGVSPFSSSQLENPNKHHVCLSTLVQAQLHSCGISPDKIMVSNIDTKTTPSFHSYRRDKETLGRNLSFVARRR